MTLHKMKMSEFKDSDLDKLMAGEITISIYTPRHMFVTVKLEELLRYADKPEIAAHLLYGPFLALLKEAKKTIDNPIWHNV